MEFHLLELINQIGSPSRCRSHLYPRNSDFLCGGARVSTQRGGSRIRTASAANVIIHSFGGNNTCLNTGGSLQELVIANGGGEQCQPLQQVEELNRVSASHDA
jgi:hypothetical protein